METLQLAQMLADLSNLNAADPHSSDSLFGFNKTATQRPSDAINSTPTPTYAPTTPLPPPSTPAQQPTNHRSTPTSAPGPAAASGPFPPPPASRTTGTSTPFDTYIGRRLLSPPVSGPNSLPGTPHGESESDVDRASALLALYELRAKLKQYNDNNSLQQARERIVALSTRQQKKPQHAGSTTSSGVSQPPPGLQHTQYTYPHVNSK